MKKYIKEILIVLAITFAVLAFPWICTKIGNAGVSGGSGSGTGATAFTGLTDVPASYSGAGGKAVTVNSGATALEFTTAGSGDMVLAGTQTVTGTKTYNSGKLVATSPTFTGTVGAAAITATGAIAGQSIGATYGVTGSTGVFSGAISGTSITGTGAISGQSVAATYGVTGSTANFTGAVTCASLSATGSGTSTTTDLSVTYGLTVGTGTFTKSLTSTYGVASATSTVTGTATIGTVAATNITDTYGISAATYTATGTQAFHGMYKEYDFTVVSPSNTYSLTGSSLPIVCDLPFAITIDSVAVQCNADPATELNMNLRSATSPIGWASPTTNVVLNTATGFLKTSTIASANVAADQCLYLNWNAAPDTAMTFFTVTIKAHYQ